MMGIYQWTFQKEALLVYCFQVKLQFGVLLFVKVGRQENCNLYLYQFPLPHAVFKRVASQL